MTLASVKVALANVLADCSIDSLADRIARAEQVDPELARLNPMLVTKEIADRRARALESCNRTLDQGAETLRELFANVYELKRKATLPLSSAISPTKNELGRYLDQRAHAVVKASVEAGSIDSLLHELDDATTYDEPEYLSRLVSWSRLYYHNPTPSTLEALLKHWSAYDKKLDLPAYDSLLKTIKANIEALEGRCALVASPALLRPQDGATWEAMLRASGQAL
jgi:hypothetical protein